MDDNTNQEQTTEQQVEQALREDITVVPLTFPDDAAVLSNAQYTAATIAEHEDEPVRLSPHVRNLIHTYLDEIDTASSIPGADTRIRSVTRKIRNII